MTKCEDCGVILWAHNESPSEIHDQCVPCWLKGEEAKKANPGYVTLIKAEYERR